MLKRFLISSAILCLLAVPSFAVVRAYTIYATDGFITMQDGSRQYMFGFNDTGVKGQIQFPSPLIWGELGDEIRITLVQLGFKFRPDLADPHTVHLHGVHVVPYFDGFPESSFGVPMGKSFTYRFIANREGTFMYHCHVEAVEHVQMGMYGPLVIYANATKTIYGQPYSKEYIWLYSELDSRWHQDLELGGNIGYVPPAISPSEQTNPPIPFAQWVRVNYRPDYWMLNGLGFPDTILTGATLPKRTLVAGKVAGIQNGIFVANGRAAHAGLQRGTMLEVSGAERVLIRHINLGYEGHPMHAHCQHYELIGKDATPLPNVKAAMAGQPYFTREDFTLTIHSGETWDTIWYAPVAQMQASNALVPQPETNPFPGFQGALYDPSPNGFFYWPAHCHDDYHVADQGIYPTGMLTLIKASKKSILTAVPAPGGM